MNIPYIQYLDTALDWLIVSETDGTLRCWESLWLELLKPLSGGEEIVGVSINSFLAILKQTRSRVSREIDEEYEFLSRGWIRAHQYPKPPVFRPATWYAEEGDTLVCAFEHALSYERVQANGWLVLWKSDTGQKSQIIGLEIAGFKAMIRNPLDFMMMFRSAERALPRLSWFRRAKAFLKRWVKKFWPS